MSDTYKAIKTQWIKFRKEKHEMATFLGTIVSDCNALAKNAGRDAPTEPEVQSVLKKFLKGLDASLGVNPKATELLQQRNFVKTFIPEVMTEAELRDKLRGLKFSNMGEAMKYMKSNYGATVDMKMASIVAKDFIDG